jgi:hypothetical protein
MPVRSCSHPRVRSRLARLRRVGLLVALVLLPTGLRAQGLPTQLADSTFWRLVTEFSEPGGFFRSDNFVSNETAWQMVIPDLAPVLPTGGAYLGVGPEQNFTYIANLRPALAFIVDIRRQNLVQHLLYKALAELSPDRAGFVSRLFSRPLPAGVPTDASVVELLVPMVRVPADSALFQRTLGEVTAHLTITHGFPLSVDELGMLEYVLATFAASGPGVTYSSNQQTRGGIGMMRAMPSFLELMVQEDGAGANRSFLASEALYAVFRGYQQRNAIVPVTGDFAGPTALRRVGDYVRQHGATVDLFYLSNVEQYLFQQGDDWWRFYENVATLPLAPPAASCAR